MCMYMYVYIIIYCTGKELCETQYVIRQLVQLCTHRYLSLHFLNTTIHLSPRRLDSRLVIKPIVSRKIQERVVASEVCVRPPAGGRRREVVSVIHLDFHLLISSPCIDGTEVKKWWK